MFKRLSIASVIVIGVVGGTVLAQTAATSSYFAEKSIEPGTIVSLRQGEKELVEPSTRELSANLFGVVVRQTDSTLRVSNGDSAVFVTTLGKARALVSDINGVINAGDQISLSPITGVGQYAQDDSVTIGTALEDFDTTASIVSSVEVTDSEGRETTANVGLIDIQVKPQLGNNSILPSGIADFGENIAGKPVSSFRLFTALAVMVVSLSASSVLLFGAIRSALVAIGRNPLSKSLVYRGLFQVMAITFIIFAAGVVGAYVILTV
jgi:hypothetical protein